MGGVGLSGGNLSTITAMGASCPMTRKDCDNLRLRGNSNVGKWQLPSEVARLVEQEFKTNKGKKV